MPTYQLPISRDLEGQRIDLDAYPELDLIYLHSMNSICPKMARCILASEVRITFLADGEEITVSSLDREPKGIQTGYIFRGHDYEFKNGKVYLSFSVY